MRLYKECCLCAKHHWKFIRHEWYREQVDGNMALMDLYIAVGMLENQGKNVSFNANSCYWKLLLKIYIIEKFCVTSSYNIHLSRISSINSLYQNMLFSCQRWLFHAYSRWNFDLLYSRWYCNKTTTRSMYVCKGWAIKPAPAPRPSTIYLLPLQLTPY
jgi:hypothetical protein